jgi:hypothetical protein
MSELTEDFLKMIQIALVVVGVLSIFFIFIQYNIALQYSYARNEALMLGDYSLSSDCLAEASAETGHIMKAVLSKSKIENYEDGCIKYPVGYLRITTLDKTFTKTIIIGQTASEENDEEDTKKDTGTASFIIALKDGNNIVPAKMVVRV